MLARGSLNAAEKLRRIEPILFLLNCFSDQAEKVP